jgi:hypothetical protein
VVPVRADDENRRAQLSGHPYQGVGDIAVVGDGTAVRV